MNRGSRARSRVAFLAVPGAAWLVLLSAPSLAQNPAATTSLVHARIQGAIHENELAFITGSRSKILDAAVDQGRLAADRQLGPMFLTLRPSAEQERALQALIDQQQNPHSANYHRWLSPDAFGAQYGVAPSDLQQIVGWLEVHGLTVNQLAHGRRQINFRGTVAQVEEAFHTEMHSYLLNGQSHYANSTDIAIPAALAPVVAGVESLNDFRPLAMRGMGRTLLPTPGNPSPLLTASGGAHYVSPGDFSIIYNTQPLLQKGTDGAGVTVAIVGLSGNIASPDPNIQEFRNLFLPNYNRYNVAIVTPTSCAAPPAGTVADAEAYGDLELSGASAPNAQIDYVPANTVYCAAQYVVDTNLAPILSISFGLCEASLGASNASISALWEQGAAEGISIFLATGDGGSAGCDNFDTEQAAYDGYAVSGYSSTPFNIAVGGTQFSEGSNTGYWNPESSSTPLTNMPYTSAHGYIPENTWNESAASATPLLGGILAGGGGVSRCYGLPSWQAGTGVPSQDPVDFTPMSCGTASVSGPHRYLPDVSLSVAKHDARIFCAPAYPCASSAGGGIVVGLFGGTSAAAPSMAGIQALVDEVYGRQGQADYVYYQLAARQNAADCDSTSAGGPASTCVFNYVTEGNNQVPCLDNSPDCPASAPFVLPLFSAGQGYDLTTGLGSVNAANLVDQWQEVSAAQALLSRSSLVLGNEVVGNSSTAQTVTLSNPGSLALNIASISAGGNFSQTNTCGSSLGAGMNCTVSVIFNPTAAGTATGALTIVDNAPDSPQVAVLNGTGQDFTLGVATGSSAVAFVPPGQPGTFSLNAVGEDGFSQSVNFTCSGGPQVGTCSVTPSAAAVGSSPTTVNVSVSTLGVTGAAPRFRPWTGWPPQAPLRRMLWMAVVALALAALAMRAFHPREARRRLALRLILAATLGLLWTLAACGGGSTGSNRATPGGVYSFTITGTSGSGPAVLTHTLTLSLNVS